MNVIELDGLHKKFGKKKVLQGLSLDIEQGSILGFVGENGAGKTTTIKILMGLEHPGKGRAKLLGQDCSKDLSGRRREAAFVSETMDLPPFLSGRELTKMHSRLYPDWDASLAGDLGKKLDLDMTCRCSEFSRGQKARLKLLLAFSQKPKVVIIDEITAGLDPLVRHDLYSLLKELACKREGAIFFTTNLLYELEGFASEIVLLQEGITAFREPVENLLARYTTITMHSLDELDSIPEHMVVDKTVDQNGAHAVIDSNDLEKIKSLSDLHKHNPKFSHPDLEKTFVYSVRALKAESTGE